MIALRCSPSTLVQHSKFDTVRQALRSIRVKVLMKTTIAALLLSTAMFANAAEAQQKIGVVNFQGVFQNLPQARALETTIQEEFKARIEEVQGIEDKLNEMREKQQRDASIMSNNEKVQLGRDFELQESAYQLKVRALREDMNRRLGEERDKLMMEIARAAQSLAQEMQYDLVVQATAVAYVSEAHELTQEVIDKMTGN
ncbi:molecular chaperone [Pseudidiomarina taiwanensis]|uniref:Molecular chaperone n=2 Tax=Pseudidiomarina taiwanensis TaxID=337250 RepID=A0A432ZNL8_9GAMM|nr:molecular chaperone [Pseudidiomarina taiwanensis]